MHRVITAIIALALCTEQVLSQPGFQQKLLLLEKQVFSSTDASTKAEWILKKLDCHIEHKSFLEEALNEAKRIQYSHLSDTISQRRFLWNASLLFYIHGDKSRSLGYFNLYQGLCPDPRTASQLLGILINSSYDREYTTRMIDSLSSKDADLACLSCLNEISAYERPNKNLYVVASAMVPGAGSILNGNIFKGLSSLSLNSGAGVVTYLLIKNNLYANALLFGGSMFLKFYSGNIRLTKKLVYQKEEEHKNALANECMSKVKSVCNKYPLTFR